MKLFDVKASFSGGELSPLLGARVDLAQYAVGARRIENFIVLPQGGLINRPGTTVVQPDVSYGLVRLFPFIFSEEDSKCMAFADGIVDIYGLVGRDLRVYGSPYRTAHLAKLRCLQSADVLYLFHPDVPVHTLSRYDADDWRFEEVEFKNGPFRDVNTDAKHTMSLSGGTLTSSKEYFTSAMEDALFKIEQHVRAGSQTLKLSKDTSTFEGTVMNVLGAFTWETQNKWAGMVHVDRIQYDDWRDVPEADWEWEEDFRTYYNEDGNWNNHSYSGTAEALTHFRFRLDRPDVEYTERTVTINFNWDGDLLERLFTIEDVWDSMHATVTVYDGINLPLSPTDAWAIGAFNRAFGWPALGVFHQERLILGQTRTDIQTLWMSRPASWHDFGTSVPTQDDDSITISLASKQVNEIRGLASRGDLLILTSGGEWNARAGAKTDVFTPSSIVVTPSGYRGSESIGTLDVGGVTLFVQRHGTAVRSLGYSLDVDGYASSDISILAEHLFQNNPVVAWDYQQTPWSVVWCVLRDGTAATLTLQQEHQVTAWTRQVFPYGLVKDVCCIPGFQDDVWLAVERAGVVKVERLQNRLSVNSGTFLDAGQWPVISVLECLEWDLQIDRTAQGRHKHISAVTFRLYETTALKAGVVNENNTALDELQIPGTLYTGDARMVIPGGMARLSRLRVENSRAAPVTVLGIFPEVEIHDG